MFKKTSFTRIASYARAHKVISAVTVVVVLGGGYWIYKKVNPTVAQTQYSLATVQTGTIISTISGSGQISPSDQITINPKASGTVTSVLVKDGQSVGAGQAIAYLDATDEYNSVQNAKASLQNAQISLQKIQEPVDQLSLTQAQDAVTKAQESQANAQTTLAKSYDDSFTDVANVFVDLPGIMNGLNNTIIFGFSPQLGGSAEWNVDFYASKINGQLNNLSGNTLSADVKAKYQTALTAYNTAFADYKSASRSESPADTQQLLQESLDAATDISDAVKSMNNLISAYQDALGPTATIPAAATSQVNSLNSYTSTVDGHISTLQSDLSAITNAQQSIVDASSTITENQESLAKLQAGPDSLDLQSAELSVQQQEQSLQQAEDDLADYTITAPISGTLANLDLHVGDTVGSGTAAATEITQGWSRSVQARLGTH